MFGDVVILANKSHHTSHHVLHVAVVMILVGRALDLYPSDWGELSSEQNAYLFEHIYNTTKNLVAAFGLLWLYEWWYIGRRRSELNDEW